MKKRIVLATSLILLTNASAANVSIISNVNDRLPARVESAGSLTGLSESINQLINNGSAGKVNVFVNNSPLKCDVNPVIVNGRTLVPLRAIAEALGANVDWNDETKTVCASNNGTDVTMQIGSSNITVNGQSIEIDTCPIIINDKTFVPLRAICVAFKCNINWDDTDNRVDIETDDSVNGGGSDNNGSDENGGSDNGSNNGTNNDSNNNQNNGSNGSNNGSASVKPENPDNENSPESDSGIQNESMEQQVLRLVNEERAKYGLSALSYSAPLAAVAKAHSEDMAKNNYFSHTSLSGKSPFDRLKEAGISYGYAAENIAAGQKTAEAVVNSWMNSEGHRANILNKNMKKMGIGIAYGGSYGIYWTQMFTN